jgi:hypothetical protein
MPFINGLFVNANGRADVVVDGAAGPNFLAGNRYTAADKLNLLTTGPVAPLGQNAGFTYDANSQLLVVSTGFTGRADHNGLRFSAAGLLVVSPTAPIDHWTHGWPMSAADELCIN